MAACEPNIIFDDGESRSDVSSDVTALLFQIEARWSQLKSEHACVLHRTHHGASWVTQEFAGDAAHWIKLDIKKVVSEMAVNNSDAIIVCHNHPGGRRRPSGADIRTTQSIAQICRTMQVDLIDHIIFSPGRYFSFRDAGYL